MTHKAAWATYTATPEFADLSARATHYKHVEGSLEAAFAAGRAGGVEDAAKIADLYHETSTHDALYIAAEIRALKEQP